MSRGPHNTKQADIRKAVNGVIEGFRGHGLKLGPVRVEVERGGKIIITTGERAAEISDDADLDEELAELEARNGAN